MEIGKKGVIQEKENRFTGISRSGNHAIINWVIKQLNGSFCFLNCTEPKQNPYFTARPLNPAGKVLETNLIDLDLQAEQKGNFQKKKHLLYSHEDCFLGPLDHKIFKENHDLWVGKSEHFQDVLILRDPFNLFASRIKSGLIEGHNTHHGTSPISRRTLIRIYKQHAREFLGINNYLRNKICVNYNKWASSKNYRKHIAEEMGIPFTDDGFEEVKEVAGGSSFDGISYSGKASTMKVNSRWKAFEGEKDFWNLFDVELVELSEKIFGESPAIEHWKNQNLEFVS